MGGAVAKIIGRFDLTYAIWFFIGVFCYIKRETLVPILKKIVPVLLVAYVIQWLLPVNLLGLYCNIAVGLLLPLIVIGGSIHYHSFVSNSI